MAAVEPSVQRAPVDGDEESARWVEELGGTGPTFTIGRDGTTTVIDQAATGQAATCWIATDGTHFYTSNAGSASVSGYTATSDGILQALGNTATDAGTVDAAASPDGNFLYVQAGAAGIVDAFRISAGGSLTAIGAVTVPGAAGGEGIAVS